MIGKLAALILLCRAYLIQGADAARPLSLAVAKVGGNAILKCSASEENQFFQWFKQSPGYLHQELASGHTLKISKPFKEPHFTATRDKGDSFLTITNVSKEDEAVYICQTGVGYAQRLNTGFFLAVHDDDQQKCVDLKQSPEAATVTPGDSVNLQCSLSTKSTTEQCPGGHDVHWIRSGSAKSHPSLIYTLWNSAEQVEKSCVYSLSKAVQNSLDAGTYYCAVVTCGKILFGGGTKVAIGEQWDPTIAILGILLALCVMVIAVLIFTRH